MKIALDTNILIYFLEGIEPQATKVEKLFGSFMKRENEGILSTMSIAEVLTGFYASGETERAAKTIRLLKDLTLDSFKIVPVTFEIADLAASLRAKRGGKLPGALIAATALDQRAKLVYSQDKDFQRFNEDIKTCELP
jgi:predicted nucleic acid-binding protein